MICLRVYWFYLLFLLASCCSKSCIDCSASFTRSSNVSVVFWCRWISSVSSLASSFNSIRCSSIIRSNSSFWILIRRASSYKHNTTVSWILIQWTSSNKHNTVVFWILRQQASSNKHNTTVFWILIHKKHPFLQKQYILLNNDMMDTFLPVKYRSSEYWFKEDLPTSTIQVFGNPYLHLVL